MQDRLVRLGFVAIAALGGMLAACDATPGPTPIDQQPPVVADLNVAPDTIRIAALPAERVANGEATVDIATTVTAHDPDGTIDRVLVVVDPAYGPTAVLAELLPAENDRFGGVLHYVVDATRADAFMVRAYAVDNDSLTSNQVIGQVHLLPDDAN